MPQPATGVAAAAPPAMGPAAAPAMPPVVPAPADPLAQLAAASHAPPSPSHAIRKRRGSNPMVAIGVCLLVVLIGAGGVFLVLKIRSASREREQAERRQRIQTETQKLVDVMASMGAQPKMKDVEAGRQAMDATPAEFSAALKEIGESSPQYRPGLTIALKTYMDADELRALKQRWGISEVAIASTQPTVPAGETDSGVDVPAK